MATGIAGRGGYHHGDLRQAMIDAAEAVLAEKGVEGFTLRECARRNEFARADISQISLTAKYYSL